MCTYIVAPNQVGNSMAPPYDTLKRVAVIETWMGHTCVACPMGDSILAAIDSIQGEYFCAIAIHDGFFAQPCPPNAIPSCGIGFPGAFSDDFTCATGQSYTQMMPMGASAPVQGMINRKDFPLDALKGTFSWSDHVDTIVNQTAVASMHFLHTYNSVTREITASVWGTWLLNYNGNVNIAIMLKEDGLIGWQADGLACDSQYVFNEVLRDCINTPGSVAGIPVHAGPNVVGTSYSYTLAAPYTVGTSINAGNCELVALLYDINTGTILQAWEEDL
jgi:hypothetical protein